MSACGPRNHIAFTGHFAVYWPRETFLNLSLRASRVWLMTVRKFALRVWYPAARTASIASATPIVLPLSTFASTSTRLVVFFARGPRRPRLGAPNEPPPDERPRDSSCESI